MNSSFFLRSRHVIHMLCCLYFHPMLLTIVTPYQCYILHISSFSYIHLKTYVGLAVTVSVYDVKLSIARCYHPLPLVVLIFLSCYYSYWIRSSTSTYYIASARNILRTVKYKMYVYIHIFFIEPNSSSILYSSDQLFGHASQPINLERKFILSQTFGILRFFLFLHLSKICEHLVGRVPQLKGGLDGV